MGCDIHLYVEKLEKEKWVSADKWSKEKNDDDSDMERVAYDDQIYTGRNYDLFGILADVRNGRGFAGVDMGDGFIPIDMPRDLPHDVSPEVGKMADYWEGDGHSHSHFTLKELIDYDWKGQSTKLRGVVSEAVYKEWMQKGKKGSPSTWCGDVAGGKIMKVSNKKMEQRINNRIKPKDDKYYHTQVEWESSYYESCKEFVDEIIPKLKEMGKPEEVRIVFWFDN